MAKSELCYLYLTCANTVEAGEISDALLKKNLIMCSKQLAVNSRFHWKGDIDHNSEMMLIMNSRMDLFDEVEAEVKKLHSYETYVLEAIPLARISKGAQQWMEDNLKAAK